VLRYPRPAPGSSKHVVGLKCQHVGRRRCVIRADVNVQAGQLDGLITADPGKARPGPYAMLFLSAAPFEQSDLVSSHRRNSPARTRRGRRRQ
jgi:hypothetical protein